MYIKEKTETSQKETNFPKKKGNVKKTSRIYDLILKHVVRTIQYKCKCFFSFSFLLRHGCVFCKNVFSYRFNTRVHLRYITFLNLFFFFTTIWPLLLTLIELTQFYIHKHRHYTYTMHIYMPCFVLTLQKIFSNSQYSNLN